MGIDHIVVDVEIKKCIGEDGLTWDDTDKLGVSVAVVYEFASGRFRIYGDSPEELGDLRSRLLRADRISGFNIWKFDFPVIFGLPAREKVDVLLPKTNDILRRIWLGLQLKPDEFSSLHKGWGLDAVSRATLKSPGKIANGALAPKWYQAGLFGKLANYCLDDVTLERDLTVFCDLYGYVMNETGRVVNLGPEGI
jgi:DEAD/DEAH box helicase domain-containing protein